MRTGEPAYSAVMSQSDPTAVLAEMKRTEALLRDARSVLRRVDALAAKASTSDDPSRGLIAEVRTACEHLVSQLAHRQQIERRSACADAPRTSARDMSSVGRYRPAWTRSGHRRQAPAGRRSLVGDARSRSPVVRASRVGDRRMGDYCGWAGFTPMSRAISSHFQ
jgi:hypothetical protein